MPRLEDAVILMEISSKINFVVGNEKVMQEMGQCRPLPIFSELAIQGLSVLSKILLRDAESKAYPDVMTFAFWCRKASLSEMRRRYEDDGLRLGRGMVFHVAPSNVPLNFAYSFVVSLLAGNVSVVRLPSKDFRQTDMVCDAMKRVLEEVPELRPYVLFVRYGHEKDINDYFSSECSTRVIWGGDTTINILRQSPLSPRAAEITLADRYSLAIIHSDRYLETADKSVLARSFYNDTYYTDQNACTSPCIVFWLGNRQEEARKLFWSTLRRLAEKEYMLQPIQGMDKFVHFCELAANKKTLLEPEKDNVLTRVTLCELDSDVTNYRGNSGFFMEYGGKELDDLLPVCGERCQTISYYGIEKKEWHDFLVRNTPKGIDRVVPIGKTLDFKVFWDGVDFIRRMSREIDIV